jgi:Tfp pilus assembly protein PilO
MPRSQTERLWMIAGGIVAAALIVIGYLAFISPQQSKTDAVDTQVAAAQSRNDALQARVDALKSQSRNLERYKAAAAQARLALPDASGLSDFLRTLQTIGNQTNTDLASLTVGAPKEVTSVASGAAAATTSAGTATPAPATPAPAAAAAANAPQVYALPITASVQGSVNSLNDFLTQLQSVQPRAVLVSQIAETVGGASSGGTKTSGTTSISLTMYAFVAPGTAAEATQLQQAAGK